MEENSVQGIILLLRILYQDKCFMHPVSRDTTYDMIREEICRRHKFPVQEIFTLVYFTPGSKECLLQSEADFKMMIFASKIYEFKQLDITVRLPEADSPDGIRRFDLNLEFNEDEYLGAPFKSFQNKAYLSDEWGSYIICVGQKFNGGVYEFCEKLKKYAIQKGFFYYYARNDKAYIYVQCEDVDCQFFIKGSVHSANQCFYIDDCELIHTCKCVLRKMSHQRLDYDIVAHCVLNDVMYNPNIRPKEIIIKFKLNYGFNIGYKVARNARTKALEQIFGKEKDSFNKLMWYTDEVKKTNPGSYVHVEVDETTNQFKRVFVAYGGCVAGFQHCVPVLYIDGCHGNSTYKGQILAATSKDGNKGIFPLAVCVCDSETEDNWIYFFTHLKKIIDAQTRVITFLSDRGVGLLAACDRIFPDNPHLYCYVHLKNNLRRRYTGKGSNAKTETVISCFFTCAYSSTEKEYYHNLQDLRKAGGTDIIDEFLKDLPLDRWCRAFVVGSRYGIMANSIAECFNSWICLERAMPVYSMLEEIRLKQMEMLNDRRMLGKNWNTTLTPKMEQVLQDEIDKCRRFKVIQSHDGVYEVRDVYSYEVDLNSHTCSCKKWQINSFPCPHALSAIMGSRLDVYEYIHSVFKVFTYHKCYENPIKPVPNIDECFYDGCDFYVEAPLVKTQVGRPKKRRIKSGGEVISAKKSIVCGRCKKKGNHNKASCSQPI